MFNPKEIESTPGFKDLARKIFTSTQKCNSLLSEEEIRRLLLVAISGYLQAISTWEVHGNELNSKEAAILLSDSGIAAEIPGHTQVSEFDPQLDKFIAFVVDMRGSTEHLTRCRPPDKIQTLQSVFYETSILLPVLSELVYLRGGGVTEYLGDGILAYFRAADDELDSIIPTVYLAAQDCLIAAEKIVNQILADLGIPKLQIGIGMAYSKALVTVVGTPRHRQAKVFGEAQTKSGWIEHLSICVLTMKTAK